MPWNKNDPLICPIATPAAQPGRYTERKNRGAAAKNGTKFYIPITRYTGTDIGRVLGSGPVLAE